MAMQQTIVEVSDLKQPAPPETMGSSCSQMISEQFPASPIIGSEPVITDDAIKEVFRLLVMRGTDVTEGSPEGSQGYYAFEEPFSRDYIGYGNLTPPANDFEWEIIGDPTNSFLPNVESAPGADPYKQPAPSDPVKNYANNAGRKGSAPFVGMGTTLSPQVFAEGIVNGSYGWAMENAAETLGMYLKGTSDVSFNPAISAKGGGPNAGMA